MEMRGKLCSGFFVIRFISILTLNTEEKNNNLISIILRPKIAEIILIYILKVSEPLRALINGAPLEDARHLTHRYEKLRHEVEPQSTDTNGADLQTHINQNDVYFIAKVIHPFDAQANRELSLSIDDYVVVRQIYTFLDEMFGSIAGFGVNVASEEDDDSTIIVLIQSKIGDQVHLGVSFLVYDYKTTLNIVSK
ncbi:hypothetical protein CUMW_149770 [Citrus unshiu]|nr:hypothetical protein CUMW_149770 [Citrus unshiu]